MQQLNPSEISEIIKQRIAKLDVSAQARNEGTVVSVSDGIDEAFRNFVGVLGENDRLELIPTISVQFELLKAEGERSIDVEIESAYEMDAEQLNNLAAALSKRLDRTVQPTTTVNPALIGGVIIRAGDLVIDGSVRGKLHKLAEALKS